MAGRTPAGFFLYLVLIVVPFSRQGGVGVGVGFRWTNYVFYACYWHIWLTYKHKTNIHMYTLTFHVGRPDKVVDVGHTEVPQWLFDQFLDGIRDQYTSDVCGFV